MRAYTSQRRRFSFFSLAFIIPGALLIWFSLSVLYTNVYREIKWKKTTGLVIGLDHKWSGDDTYVYERVRFRDTSGQEIEFTNMYSAGSSEANWSQAGEVKVYYNPDNPAEAVIYSWGNYLGFLLLPFGVFLVVFGWPEKSER